MNDGARAFCASLGIDVPLICGAMYPCSNPELVAAVSAAGGIGIVQPLSLVYVHGHEFREGMALIASLTPKPVGLNVIVEKSSKIYLERMRRYTAEALELGVRFFVTSLGNPRFVVDMAHEVGGLVYHDVTERRWAEKALEAGVDGLIAVNDRAGGHAGNLGARRLIEDLEPLGVPVVAAGGIGAPSDFAEILQMGYVGAQLGTRFIATSECDAHPDYKRAIVEAGEDDVMLTERITGVPVSIVKTPHAERIGGKAGRIGRFFLTHRRTKHLMRALYSARSVWQLKRSLKRPASSKDYWQAGKSVAGIDESLPAAEIVRRFSAAIAEGAGPAI